MLGTLGLAVGAKLDAANGAGLLPKLAAQAGDSSEPYGSSHFGRWAEDEFGLPTFEYSCNQTTDPKAVTPIKPGILLPTEHVHQVGNDRITALASNYGHVRVRQDEGGPKILNDVDPETHQFGGGIGYLTDGTETLNTWYDGSDAKFERIFGVGYFRKRVASDKYSAEQTIWAPFGDDPVLLSEVKITNHGSASAKLTWVEYWGCQPYQLSFRDFMEAANGLGEITDLRRKAGRKFTHRIAAIDGKRGLMEQKRFTGWTAAEEQAWQQVKARLEAEPTQFLVAVHDDRPGTYLDNGDVAPTFLVSLDRPAEALCNDAATFFGSGGAANPSGLKSTVGDNLTEEPQHAGLILARSLHLAPKESKTLSFLYGYVAHGFKIESLMAKYQTAPGAGLKQSSTEWKRHGMRFEVAAEPWMKRESTWNHYYLRSNLTYDDYFGEHILNQNGYYQYVMGFQGAARDPLQHSLPFLFSDPEIVRSVLRYTLKEVRDDGSVPYGIVGHGVIAPVVTDNASELPLWLIWTACEYVMATRDTAFLDESIPARFSAQAGRTDTVRNLLARCYHHQIDQVGVGKHGIVRMLNDDWNDGLVGTWATTAFDECVKEGESVVNTAMSAWVFDLYNRTLRYAGDTTAVAAQASKSAEKMRAATRTQWNGKWMKRAWLGQTLGWLGEDTLWIEPQPWAILCGATTPEQSRELVATMNTELRRGPIGAAQMNDGPDMRKTRTFHAGDCICGGVWPSLNQTLVWALAKVDPAMAWDEWKRNTLACHAQSYPHLWYGVWTGTDSYNSFLSDKPGENSDDPGYGGIAFPILNSHAHACSLYSVAKLLGVEFTADGMTVAPEAPSGAYRLESPLLGVVKKAEGRYEGWYMPSKAGEWTVEVKLPEQMAKKIAHVEVNGAATGLKRRADGTIAITGRSEAGKALRWSLS